MSLDVTIDTGKVGLIDHRELEFLGIGGGAGASGNVEVESALKDGCVGDGIDGRKGEEDQGFLEAP